MLKRFISYYGPHKKLFVLDMFMGLVRALAIIAIPVVVKRIIDVYVPASNSRMVFYATALLFLLTFIMAFAAFINTKWGHILGTRIETDMRRDLFRHLQKLSFSYFDNVKTGSIMSRISNDLFTISEVAHHAPEDIFLATCMVTGSFAVMFTINPTLALVTSIPIPLILIWGNFFKVRLRASFRAVRKKISAINSSVENSIQGIREVKSYAQENKEMARFGSVNGEFRQAKEDMYHNMAGFHSSMMFIMQSYKFLVIAGGSYLIIEGKLELSSLIAFLLYVQLIINPIQRLVNFIEQYQQGVASFERFVEIMDVEPEINDRPKTVDVDKFKGDLKISKLSFSYSDDSDAVLNDINMDIKSGDTIALVGESGAGKSTLASLIPRFYEAKNGEILIDGINILDLKQRVLRERIGIVQQNVFLFDTSIRENIMFGRPEATEEELIQAAKDANIYDFISSLEDGFDTLVGEHGVKLSGGQRQRVSIARVFLKQPDLLIFDEATSALDTESEELIQKSMEKLSEGRTTIVIAHRLSTVKMADYTFVMRNGKVIEEGKHQELVAQKGYYHDLYMRNTLVI